MCQQSPNIPDNCSNQGSLVEFVLHAVKDYNLTTTSTAQSLSWKKMVLTFVGQPYFTQQNALQS